MKSSYHLARWGIPFFAVIFGVVALFIISSSNSQEATVTPTTTPAMSPQAASIIAGAGVVEPSSELISIASALPGVIATVDVEVGDSVKKGDLLFTLDSRAIRAELSQQEANAAVAQSRLDESRIELEDRLESLKLYEAIGDARAITQEELQRRRYAVDLARARVATEEANLELAKAFISASRVDLDKHSVRSPLDATVLRLQVKPGQFAPAALLSEPLATLGRTDPLYARVDIDEADLGRLRPGSPATISPRGDSKNQVSAQFIRVDPLVIPKRSLTNSTSERVDTRVLQVIFSLPSDARGFYPGQQVDAFVVIEGTK